MTQIRVMTFNVNWDTNDVEEEAHQWRNRAALNVRTIRKYRPDLIGFQELWRGNLETYQEQLEGYSYVLGHPYGEEDYPSWNGIAWNATRFKLLDEGGFWLSHTPDVFSSDWGVENPLTATWVKLEALETGLQFIHLNTHFEDGPWGEESRIGSSRLLNERLALLQEGHLPAIATGDFNTHPWSLPYRTFIESGFIDTFREAGNADNAEASTLHGYRGKEYFALEWGDQTFWRVDWILARAGAQRVQTLSSTIVRDADPPYYPSDHYPVVSEILFLE